MQNFSADKVKKIIISNLPLLLFFWIGDKLCFAFRTANGTDLYTKFSPFIENFTDSITNPFPSLNLIDLVFGIGIAILFKVFITYKRKHAKKYRDGKEYGNAVWGTEKDIEPYMDKKNFDNNVLLTKTERLTMGKPSAQKYARNKNVLVIGGAGSGKTRGYVKPNLMQMHSSYIVTDPKGTVLVETGAMLKKGRPVKQSDGSITYEPYKIRVFNTIDFSKSMHYNPFAYIKPETREQDILKFVDVLIKNTNSKQKTGGDDFWEKAERLLYSAYIALIITMCPEDEWNFQTLIEFINSSECHEEDEGFMNAIDYAFYYLEKWIENLWYEDEEFDEETENYRELQNDIPTAEQISLGKFAVRQYKAYKLAAGDVCSK